MFLFSSESGALMLKFISIVFNKTHNTITNKNLKAMVRSMLFGVKAVGDEQPSGE